MVTKIPFTPLEREWVRIKAGEEFPIVRVVEFDPTPPGELWRCAQAESSDGWLFNFRDPWGVGTARHPLGAPGDVLVCVTTERMLPLGLNPLSSGIHNLPKMVDHERVYRLPVTEQGCEFMHPSDPGGKPGGGVVRFKKWHWTGKAGVAL